MARETLELLRPELENRRLNVKEKLARRVPLTPLDTGQMKQVLVNLIKNAMEAMLNAMEAMRDAGVPVADVLALMRPRRKAAVTGSSGAGGGERANNYARWAARRDPSDPAAQFDAYIEPFVGSGQLRAPFATRRPSCFDGRRR